MGQAPSNGPLRYRVGDLILDKGSRRVTRDGETLDLGGLTFDLLVGLVESAPDLVTYDRIAGLVWQGRPVANETITQRAKMLRDALSEDAAAPRYFESVRGQGYRLVAGVEPIFSETAGRPTGRRSIAIGITVLAAVLLATAGVIFVNTDGTPSVAVLPFADMSEHGDQSYFADGVAEELINALMEWQVAEESFATSLSLRRDRTNLASYSHMLMRAGRSRAALAVQLEADALERMPRPPSRLRFILYLALRDFDAARELAARLPENRRLESGVLIALNGGTTEDLRRAMQAMPANQAVTETLYAPLLGLLDSPQRALALLGSVLDDQQAVWPDKYHDIALLAAWFGDPDLALEAFSREMPYTTIRFGALWYPVMAEARRLPRFRELVSEARLPDYWRNYGWADFCRPVGHSDFECF